MGGGEIPAPPEKLLPERNGPLELVSHFGGAVQPIRRRAVVPSTTGKSVTACRYFGLTLEFVGPFRRMAENGFARNTVQVLEIDGESSVITRDQVEHATPDPDLFIAVTQPSTHFQSRR